MSLVSFYIKQGDTVLLQLPTNEMKSIKIDHSRVNLGKFGTFNGNELIGKPFGYSYEIVEKELKLIPPPRLGDVEDTDATNEFINDTEETQEMTYADIEAMKDSGAHASEIINRQISQHASFALKTEYSKDKYIKRKTAKFSKTFTVLENTIHNICEFWFQKDTPRIRGIRPDTLAQVLSLSGVCPGSRVIVVDDASGLIVASVFDRLDGRGKLFSICDVESQPVYHIVQYLNRPQEQVDAVVASLNWATADPSFTPPSTNSEQPVDNERQKSRRNKRQLATSNLLEARADLFHGNFDSLIIASQHDAFSIVDRLFEYLGGSASIVIHSPYSQQVCAWQLQMKGDSRFLAPTVIEPWLRKYQVLPGRTHPNMTSTGSGGFILHTTKILT